jgi:hypothetical protein
MTRNRLVLPRPVIEAAIGVRPALHVVGRRFLVRTRPPPVYRSWGVDHGQHLRRALPPTPQVVWQSALGTTRRLPVELSLRTSDVEDAQHLRQSLPPTPQVVRRVLGLPSLLVPIPPPQQLGFKHASSPLIRVEQIY